jgi:hypothetical protein
MSSVFVASLNFEEASKSDTTDHIVDEQNGDESYDDWLLQRKVKTPRGDEWDEGELGDSCCFGTRTVEIGMDCVWKLHGGV